MTECGGRITDYGGRITEGGLRIMDDGMRKLENGWGIRIPTSGIGGIPAACSNF